MIPKIKINQIYQHPTKGTVVVHYEFDIGDSGNINFNPIMFENMTKQQIKETINLQLEGLYQQREKIKNISLKKNISDAIKEIGSGV